MHPDPIVRRFHACALAGVPANLIGDPGSGKTSRILAYGEALNLKPQEGMDRFILSRCESIDLRPRLFFEGKVLVVDPPELARLRSRQASLIPWILGILFLDELNRAPREVEGAALDIIDRPPQGIVVFAACNRQTRGQAVRNLGSAAANRFCHLDVAPDANAYAKALVEGGWNSGSPQDFAPPSEEDLAKAKTKTAFLISSFIRRHQEILEAEPQDPVKAGRAWPSPRTWEHVLKLESIARALDYSFEDRQALINGCVGYGPGTEFLAFAQDADLVDPEEVLKDPQSFTPDKARVDKTIAALTSIAGAVQNNFTEPRWQAAWKCVNRCVEADQKDAGVVGADLLVMTHGGLSEAKKQGITPVRRVIPTALAMILASGSGSK